MTSTDPTVVTTEAPGTNGAVSVAANVANGVATLRLSAGTASNTVAVAPVEVVDGTPLGEDATAALIARLPEWIVGSAETDTFRWPVESRPAPTAVNNIEQAFPPTDDSEPPDVTTGPLHVLRHQPDGDVSIAGFVTITFDQPMVAVGTAGPMHSAAVPVTITPTVPGSWQWIGTRTLRFNASVAGIDRMPMATEYHVVVPAGMTSASGNALAADYEFDFTTPPLSVRSFSPSGGESQTTPTQVFLASFDQRVDADAVLDHVSVRAGGDTVAIRLATDDEIAADDSVRLATTDAPDARWIAFRAVDPLPLDSPITITFAAGTPSAEGPLTTTADQTFQTRTYGPLRLQNANCDYSGAPCTPTSSLQFEFSNTLDAQAFDPATVVIEPATPGLVVGVSGNYLSVWGGLQGRTDYTVTIPAGLTDTYGQTLAEAVVETFSIGPASPALRQFASPLTTLDPSAPKPHLDIVTVNHASVEVSVFAVSPSDWTAFASYLANESRDYDNTDVADPDFPRLDQRVVEIADRPDAAVITSIDLSDEIPSGAGHVVVVVRPTDRVDRDSPAAYENWPAVTWVQATTMNIDAFADQQRLVAWTTDLATGAPVTDATLQLIAPDGAAAGDAVTTNGEGVTSMALLEPGSQSSPSQPVLVASRGDDTAILPSGSQIWDTGTWWRSGQTDQALWYVADDRQVYQPGETVSVTGWVRRLTSATDSQLERFAGADGVAYTAHDAQGNEISSGMATLNPLGGFSFSFDVPADANLGAAWIDLNVSGVTGVPSASTGHRYQIEQFRRPEFEVTARPESSEPFVLGDGLTLAVDANYYAGGPLPDAPVTWQVSASAATYAPPGWDRYSFGRWTPWWLRGGGYGYGYGYDAYSDIGWQPNSEQSATFTGRTDGGGSDYLHVDIAELASDQAGYPIAVSTQASVTDLNRQTWAATTSQVVHPAGVYVGLAADATFVDAGDPLVVDAVAVAIDGTASTGREITLTATRNTTVFRNGSYESTDVDPQVCTVTSADAAQSCTFDTSTPGSYTIRAEVADDSGRVSRSEITRWVSGATTATIESVTQEALTLVPDAETYAPGDTARILVQSPVADGTGLLVVSRNGIRSTSTFDVVGGSAVVEVPIADADIPGLDLTVEVAGASPRSTTADVMRPAYAVGSLSLPISLASRTLTVTATPRDGEVTPGSTTAVDVTVTDANGAPVVGADFTVMVVDEAVLAVGGVDLADPLDAFYPRLSGWVSPRFGRDHVALVDLDALRAGTDGSTDTADTQAAATTVVESAADEQLGGMSAPTAGMDRAASAEYKSAASGPAPVEVRADFNPVAVFAPSQTTGADGRATIEVPLPDNVTRYRVAVVAAAGDDAFGATTASITARLPLTVRPSAPRFANFGDTFELPVVIQNQTDAALSVDVVLQTDNLTVTGSPGITVEVPADNRIEVRFAVATAAAGTASFRVAAASGDLADAATVSMPVYTPATAEAFATYGVIDSGGSVTAAAQPIESPEGVYPEFGGLEVSTSATALSALTDAVISVTDYPYQSSDARASRILTIAALRDVLAEFEVPNLPSAARLDSAVAADIAALVAMQNWDGGFPYWDRSNDSAPFNSIHVIHALLVARDAGHSVPQNTIDQGVWYLQSIEQYYPTWFDQDSRDSLTAYALFTRDLAGDRDSGRAASLVTSRDDVPLDALAWAWPVVDDNAVAARIETAIANRAVDTAATINFVTDPSDGDVLTLRSDRRTDGLVLDALIRERPGSDMIPKVVAGLLAGQRSGARGGQWGGIQENTFILLALHRYFETFEGTDPDFVASVWLGDRFAGEHAFTGRTTDQVTVEVPTSALIDALAGTDNDTVTIANNGSGRLYYRIAMRTAPTDLDLDPLDRGFVVTRTYEGVDDPADVTQDADGTWHIRAGARVRVRLTIDAESQRAHVALIDPLAAGLEILNPDLATTPSVPTDVGTEPTPFDWYWAWTWYDHQNLRDDRAEAFSTSLAAGVYDYSYVAVATTPGSFVVPPARAEEMYHQETFGRSGSDRVVVSS